MSGYGGGFGERDPLFFWRLHDEVSVVNAAILMVGGDPSDKEELWDEGTRDTYWAQKLSYPGYEAALGALKSAIRRGEIKASIAYPIENAGPDNWRKTSFKVIAAKDLWEILTEAETDIFGLAADRPPVQISREPDWGETNLEVESLRRWLRSKGAEDGFFVSVFDVFGADEPAQFKDSSHDHFSAELDLAVKAWSALASEQKFKGSPKAAIEAWINANPDAWLGEDRLSGSAKERIVTLANWRKSGGAPPSGG